MEDIFQNSIEPWLPVGCREEDEDDEDFHLDEGEEDQLGSEDSEEGEEEGETPYPQHGPEALQGMGPACSHSWKACCPPQLWLLVVLRHANACRAVDSSQASVHLEVLLASFVSWQARHFMASSSSVM